MIQTGLNSKNMECGCKNIPKEQFIAIPGCSDDFSAISALPDQWTPRHCGQILTNFLKEREYNYVTICKTLKDEAIVINENVDNKVRIIADILLSHINQNEADMECVIKKCKSDDIAISLEVRNNTLHKISQLCFNQVNDLVKFKQEVLGLEKQRSNNLRNMMKLYFQRLIVVGHIPPKDLLHEFDERIYEINQQLLSNCRAYTELELQLRVQVSESEVRARSVVNKLCLYSKKTLRQRSAFPWVRDANFKNNITQNAEGINGVSLNFEVFKGCVSQLIDAYNNAIAEIFTKYLNQLKILHITDRNRNDDIFQKDAFSLDSNDVMEKVVACVNNICQNYLNLKSRNLDTRIQNDAFSLQSSLASLKHCLLDTFSLIFEAACTWDNHKTRFNLLKNLALAGLEDIQNTHDGTELANEVNLNIILEYMRNASDLEKLQHHFDALNSFLDKGTKVYFHNRDAEISKIEEYKNLSSIMANLFLTECYYYLDKYQKLSSDSENETDSVDIGSIDIQMCCMHESLIQASSQTCIKEKALINWRNEFLTAFENNLLKMSEILNRQVINFLDDIILKINMRYSLKLMSHSIRAERLKSARLARLSELQVHDTRLTSHIDAINHLIDELTAEASDFLSLDAPELYPFCKWVNNIQSNVANITNQEEIDPEFKRLKLYSYSQRLSKHRQLYEESLNSAIDEFKGFVENKIQTVHISNVGFMSRLKLLSEGGRYTSSEALKACTAIARVADALETCSHRIVDILHHRRSQLLALADHQLSLQRIDDVHKLGAKDIFNKKKLTQKGKK